MHAIASPVAASALSEQDLLRAYADGDLRARDEVILRFMPVAKRLAGRYRHTGESREDLEQVAYFGLIKAVDRYDLELGPFIRYAIPNILGELKRHFRDKGWGIHVTRSVQERMLKVNEATDHLSGQLGRSPSASDIAKHLGLSVEEVSEALDAGSAYSPMALDAPQAGGEDGARVLGDTIGSEDAHYELVELGEAVGPAFRELSAREQEIVRLRLLEDLTQSEIAERIGVSQMHVSRLLRRAVDKLAQTVEDGAVSAADPA